MSRYVWCLGLHPQHRKEEIEEEENDEEEEKSQAFIEEIKLLIHKLLTTRA